VKNSPRFAVIMAGGGGTRLWPLSTREHPKHFLDLMGNGSLYQQAVSRLAPDFAPDHILVVTIREQADRLMRLTPEVPAANFLIEPEPKGTASVIGLAALAILQRAPDAVMVVLTSDHVIGNVPAFLQVLQAGCAAAESGGLYTLGIQPDFPATGYGYIEMGRQVSAADFPIYRAEKFVEKPALDVARGYLARGKHLWNSGMFIWQASQILNEMNTHMPDLRQQLSRIQALWTAQGMGADIREIWGQITPQTIDYGIMEKAGDIFVIPARDLAWNDVGSWLSLFDILDKDPQGNVHLGGTVLQQDSQDCLVVQQDPHKLIATIGVRDLVIVDTGKALLICSREDAQKVREIVAVLKSRGSTDYY
jgi:mannose-1-phosphate guanylyltransferase